LETVAFAALNRRNSAVHYLSGFRVDPNSHEGQIDYSKALRKYSSDIPPSTQTALDAISDINGLQAFLLGESSRDAEFWLFIDEAQLLYGNTSFWHVLDVDYHRNFFVVAAGTYGSHTGSSSSSPPKLVLTLKRRINLFPSPLDDDTESCIAFTEHDFCQFVDEVERVNKRDLDHNTQERIMKYASPYPSSEHWPKLLHPGVAVELTMRFFGKVCGFSVYDSLSLKLCQTVFTAARY
jgi:hypothetical protein